MKKHTVSCVLCALLVLLAVYALVAYTAFKQQRYYDSIQHSVYSTHAIQDMQQ
jgi:hypothetical protein